MAAQSIAAPLDVRTELPTVQTARSICDTHETRAIVFVWPCMIVYRQCQW